MDEGYHEGEDEDKEGTRVFVHSIPKKMRPKRKGRSVSTIIRMRRTRFRNQLPVSTDPVRTPIFQSSLECNRGITFKVGDVVKVGDGFARIRGFFRDQFCGKYAALQWLIPKVSLENGKRMMGVFDPATFIQGQNKTEPVYLEKLEFVLRIPSNLTTKRSHDLRKIRTGGGPIAYMDGVSSTISSIDYTLFQILY